ncbi:TerC family protein [Reichenbachiella carrageenanivorans]|uniref:TerC family protein n=1 Tax=Reichenbachiella carrageenanivorans TaxID=2979869 RepID=A0ABY6DA00_9BACT|nr:TerC family protein [Reichenbachiella carrageenanivorans]UXX80705.1 TerC family protein [Reichenbachiella carrageenanivorans]
MILNLFSGTNEVLLFSVFGIVIILFLIVDLGLVHKGPAKITQKDALIQTIFWIFISTVFGVLIYFFGGGPEDALEYFSAYVTEKALSVDNIFVILLILRYFKVKDEYYHDILFWGILGAIVFRAIFIFLGALLIGEFHWILYIFGIFLVYSGIKIFNEDEDMEIEPEKNLLTRWAKKILPISNSDRGGRFVFRENGKLWFTPLFLVILLIESTDLIFAVDSIPAAFAITQNEFVIYTSNIFAVMGLRAMFFLLANTLDKFYLLQKGLSVVLIFIGVKMLMEMSIIQKAFQLIGIEHAHIPIIWSFIVIMAALTFSIVLSIMFPQPETVEEATEPVEASEN